MGLLSKKTFVGLDLGHHTLKAVQMERSGGNWKIVKFGSIPTPEECIKDGVVIDQKAMTHAIKTLLRDAHINAGSANIAVSGNSIVVRPVRMPKMAESTLRKSIKFEASRYVPSSVDDSYIEFEILGPADENQMEVLMVAAPRDIVESRVAACEGAGLEVEAVEIEVFSMYRSLVETDDQAMASENAIGIIDVGSNSTNISVVTRGMFAMTRSIPLGGDTFTQALKSYFKLSDADAESGKAQLDLRELVEDSAPKENPPLRVLQPHIDELIREIRRSLNYYQSQQNEGSQNRQVDYLVLTGGSVKLPGLAEYFAHKLGLTIVAKDVLANPRFIHNAQPETNGFDLSVASGLAMRAFAKAA